jgi:hypothetical protein
MKTQKPKLRNLHASHTLGCTIPDVIHTWRRQFHRGIIVYRVALREPMHLCTCVREEGVDGEAVCSETPSLLSYTLRYVSFTEVDSFCRVAL